MKACRPRPGLSADPFFFPTPIAFLNSEIDGSVVRFGAELVFGGAGFEYIIVPFSCCSFSFAVFGD